MATLFYADESLRESAQSLAERFGFDLSSDEIPSTSEYFLVLSKKGVALVQGNNPKTQVMVDFCSGATAHRRRFGGGKGQDIAKAVGVTGAYQPSVIDATAGLGRDAFVLATLGCQVQAFERQPVVAALLEDGLKRAELDPDVADITGRISLTHGSSHELLQAPESGWLADIVYLDPMFDHDAKQTAAVKKDMQAFRDVVGQDMDADELLSRAIACARCRVVVKRARSAEPLAGKAPSYSLTGKSNRFDVYARAKVTAL